MSETVLYFKGGYIVSEAVLYFKDVYLMLQSFKGRSFQGLESLKEFCRG